MQWTFAWQYRDSPAAHGGRPLPMGWVYWSNCMSCTWRGSTWRGTPRIALSRDASAWEFLQSWHLASHNGTLPIAGNLSKGDALLIYNFWPIAKISWHAAKSIPLHPPWSWLDTYLTSITKICPENAVLCGFLTLTFDLWPWVTKNSSYIIEIYLSAKYEDSRSMGSTF